MSMELYIFSDRKLNSIAEWQSAIDAEGYPLRLSDETPFENLEGFLPSHLGEELTGFECYHQSAPEVIRAHPDITFSHEWKYLFSFCWLGSKETESRAAWMAGTAYARATGGIVMNDQDSKMRTADQSREVVYEFDHPRGATEEEMRERDEMIEQVRRSRQARGLV